VEVAEVLGVRPIAVAAFQHRIDDLGQQFGQGRASRQGMVRLLRSRKNSAPSGRASPRTLCHPGDEKPEPLSSWVLIF